MLNNALDYTPRGGRITVATGSRAEEDVLWHTLTVRDTGPGFSPTDLSALFQPFYRGSEAQNEHLRGAGLGLAICQVIMERLNGRITVDSPPGHSAAVTLWLRPAG